MVFLWFISFHTKKKMNTHPLAGDNKQRLYAETAETQRCVFFLCRERTKEACCGIDSGRISDTGKYYKEVDNVMKAIIMAAGKGTRLASLGGDLPKVLRVAGGRPLLSHVLDTASCCPADDVTIVVGYMAEKIVQAFPGYRCVKQGDGAYGTGLRCDVRRLQAAGLLDYDGEIVVLNGDMPLVRRSTVESMLDRHRRSSCACTLLSCVSARGAPVRAYHPWTPRAPSRAMFVAIVEDADCTPDQKKNSGAERRCIHI